MSRQRLSDNNDDDEEDHDDDHDHEDDDHDETEEHSKINNRIATNESKHFDILYGVLFSAELERQQTVPTSHCERSIPRQRLGSRVSQSRRVS